MSKQHEVITPEQFIEQAPEAGEAPRKVFVEPEISQPVDVLEATTFFQSATSGATN